MPGNEVRTPFERVLAKYNWANHHVEQFIAALDEWRSENPHSIGIQKDAERDEITYYVTAVPIIPDSLGFMLGDAIHNLRSTLDHLAWGLVTAANGTLDKNTGFPIGEFSKDFKGLLGSRVKGVGKYCCEAIEKINPCKDGWGRWAWQLHELDIVDKHKLVPTIATVNVGRTMTPSEKEAFNRRQSLIGPHAHAAIQYARAVFSPAASALETGDVLGTFRASEVNEDVGFSFDAAIDEREISELIPAYWLLNTFRNEILGVINELTRFL